MACETCGKSAATENIVEYRVNKVGELPARWRCEEHLDSNTEIDPDVKKIVDIILKG